MTLEVRSRAQSAKSTGESIEQQLIPVYREFKSVYTNTKDQLKIRNYLFKEVLSTAASLKKKKDLILRGPFQSWNVDISNAKSNNVEISDLVKPMIASRFILSKVS